MLDKLHTLLCTLWLSQHILYLWGMLLLQSKSTELLIRQANLWHNNGDKKSVCLPPMHTDPSSRKCSHEYEFYDQTSMKCTARKLNACTYLSARTSCLPKVKPADRQERIPDVVTPTSAGFVATKLRRCSTGTRCSVLLPNGWLLAAGVCLVTAACYVTTCIQVRY